MSITRTNFIPFDCSGYAVTQLKSILLKILCPYIDFKSISSKNECMSLHFILVFVMCMGEIQNSENLVVVWVDTIYSTLLQWNVRFSLEIQFRPFSNIFEMIDNLRNQNEVEISKRFQVFIRIHILIRPLIVLCCAKKWNNPWQPFIEARVQESINGYLQICPPRSANFRMCYRYCFFNARRQSHLVTNNWNFTEQIWFELIDSIWTYY